MAMDGSTVTMNGLAMGSIGWYRGHCPDSNVIKLVMDNMRNGHLDNGQLAKWMAQWFGGWTAQRQRNGD
jgi:hypothetical protein